MTTLRSAFQTLLLIAALALLPGHTKGQQVGPETQTAISAEAGIIEISPALRDRLGLFPDVVNFGTARLFLLTNGTTVLEVESRAGGLISRDRRVLTPGELDDLRTLIASRMEGAGDMSAFTREGRGRLVLTQTLLGLGFYGWAVPVILDLDEAQAVVGTYLLSAGAAFYLPYRLTRDRSVSRSHSNLTAYGATRGALVGALIADAVVSDDDDNQDRKRVAGALLSSVSGSLLGFHAVDRFQPSEGEASLLGAMGDFGFLGGAALAYLAGPYSWEDILVDNGEFGSYYQSRRRSPAAGHVITVAGGAVGLYLGDRMGGADVTQGNVAALRSAGILGAQVGLTLAQAMGVEEERIDGDVVSIESDTRILAAGGLIGGIAGIYLGDRLLERNQFTIGEGLLVNAGHIAGGATALGLTYLMAGSDSVDDDALLYLATGTLGSILGAGIIYRAIGDGSEVTTAGREGDGRVGGRGEVTITIQPENLILSSMNRSGRDREVLPLLSVRF